MKRAKRNLVLLRQSRSLQLSFTTHGLRLLKSSKTNYKIYRISSLRFSKSLEKWVNSNKSLVTRLMGLAVFCHKKLRHWRSLAAVCLRWKWMFKKVLRTLLTPRLRRLSFKLSPLINKLLLKSLRLNHFSYQSASRKTLYQSRRKLKNSNTLCSQALRII